LRKREDLTAAEPFCRERTNRGGEGMEHALHEECRFEIIWKRDSVLKRGKGGGKRAKKPNRGGKDGCGIRNRHRRGNSWGKKKE